MTFLNTEIHIVTFLITVFEAAMLFFAFIWFLSRPSERSRKRYVVLLLLLIIYNLFSGLFPDASINIPITIQNILAYMGGICVSMYFVYYIYMSLELENLKRLAVYGALWFLFLPFIIFFVLTYMITNDLELSRKLLVVVPFLFSVYYIITLTRAIRIRYRVLKSRTEKEETVGLYVSVLLLGHPSGYRIF